MAGCLYRASMRRADRIWERARRAERRAITYTMNDEMAMAHLFTDMAIRLSNRAKRIECRARSRRLPRSS